MVKKKEVNVQFSAEEIKQCTVIADDELTFMNRKHPPEPNKSVYGPIFNNKLMKLTNRTFGQKDFTIKDGFRDSGKHNRVVYFECPDDKRMSVSYRKVDMKADSSLDVIWRFDCLECIKLHTEHINGEMEVNVGNLPQNEPLINDPVIGRDFNSQFDKIVKDVNNYLMTVKSKCLSSLHPINALYSQKAQFGIGINSAFINSIVTVPILQDATDRVTDTINPSASAQDVANLIPEQTGSTIRNHHVLQLQHTPGDPMQPHESTDDVTRREGSDGITFEPQDLTCRVADPQGFQDVIGNMQPPLNSPNESNQHEDPLSEDDNYALQPMESIENIAVDKPRRIGLRTSEKIANDVAKKATRSRKEDLKSRRSLKFSPRAVAAMSQQQANLAKKAKHN